MGETVLLVAILYTLDILFLQIDFFRTESVLFVWDLLGCFYTCVFSTGYANRKGEREDAGEAAPAATAACTSHH